MTIAACFKFDDGMVFCADTKITTNVKTNQTKIFPNLYTGEGSYCATVFTFAGAVRYAHAAIKECERRISRLDFLKVSLEDIRKEVAAALVQFYRDHMYPNPEIDSYQFGLLAGVWLRGETRMFMSENTVVVPVDDYECLGTGAYLAKYLIRQFFGSEQQGPSRRTIEDIGLISAYALASAIEYDESCGGEAEFLVMTTDGKIGFGIDASIYPCDELPDQFQGAFWLMLRKLARAAHRSEADEIIEDFVEEIRRIGQKRVDWIDTLTTSLKKSIQPPAGQMGFGSEPPTVYESESHP